MAKLNNTKKSGKNVADDKERLASEIAARYDPNSATYKYRDKTPYQSLREKNEISTIPRTYESQRYSRSTPEGIAYRQNQSPTLTTEDYRNAANAYVTNSRRQKPQAPQSRNPRSSYYNPNWQKELTERRQAEKASVQMGKDKLAAERKQRLQERDNEIAAYGKYFSANDFKSGVAVGQHKYEAANKRERESTPGFWDIFNGAMGGGNAIITSKQAEDIQRADTIASVDAMTDDERDIYYYLLGTRGDSEAEKFRSLLQESLNYRIGTKQADLDKKVGTAGILPFVAGVDNAFAGMTNAISGVFDGPMVPDSPLQYEYKAWREGLKPVRGAINDVAYTGGNMLPSIAASAALGGLDVPSKLASALGASTLGVSAGGNAYKEGRDSGYTHKQALTYGTLVGASEAGLQAVLGGISSLGLGITEEAAGGAISRALGKVIKNTGVTDAIGRYIANMGSEATEEYLQSLLEPVFKNIVAGEQNEFNPLDEEALYSGLMGALTAGLFEAPKLALDIGGARYAEREFNAALNSMQRENTAAQEQSPADIQREAAQGVAGNEVEPPAAVNRTPANEDINRVAEAAAKAAQTQPPTNIQEAAAQAAEKAAQSPSEKQTSNNAAAPAKPAQNGVATRHTATTSNGNAVSVGSIVDTDNGLNVRLSDGTTAQLSDVDFDDPNINVLYERAASFDADTANALVNNYTGETSVDNYLRGFNSVYLSGKQGYEYAKAVGDSVYARHYLNDNARMAAFRAGQAAYQSSRANSIAGQQGNNVRPQAKAEYEAGVNREYSDRKLTSSQRKQIRALDEVFKAAGKKLVIHDAIGTDGNSVTFSRSDANAYYDAKTDTYHLSLDSTGQAYAYVVAHESIHEMEVKNKEGFSALSEVVEAAIEGELMNQKGMTFDEAKAEFEKMVQYQMDKNGLNRSEAVTEVVANTVPAILTDEQQGKRFADKVMKSGSKVKAWFEKLIKDLREILDKAYNILKGQKSWEQMELIRNNKQTLDMIADYYFEGMKGTKGKAANGDGSARYSIQTTENSKPLDKQARFSMKDTVEETRDLIAVHNLKGDELEADIELGGFPMPSIAITKPELGHSEFGDISLIFGKDTIDPKRSGNKVYNADAYTPTFPQVGYKPNEKSIKRLRDLYYKVYEKAGSDIAYPLYAFGVDDAGEAIARYGGSEQAIVKSFADNTDMMQAYLVDQGKQPIETIQREVVTEIGEPEKERYDFILNKLGKDAFEAMGTGTSRATWYEKYGESYREALKQQLIDAGIDSETAASVVADGFSRGDVLTDALKVRSYMQNGPRRVKTQPDLAATQKAIKEAVNPSEYKAWLENTFSGVVSKKGIRNDKDTFTNSGNRRSFETLYWEFNLENIVKAMKSQDEKGASGLGTKSIFGSSAREYESIADIKADSNRLQTLNEEQYAAIKETYSNRFREIVDTYAGNKDWWDAATTLCEAVARRKTRTGIYNYLNQWPQVYKASYDIVDSLISLTQDIAKMPTEYFEAKPQRAVSFDEVRAVIMPEGKYEDLQTALESRGIPVETYNPDVEGERLSKLNSEFTERFRFSRKDDVSVTSEDAKKLQKQNDKLKQALEVAKQEIKLSAGHHVKASAVERLAGSLLKEYSSKMDKAELVSNITELFDYIGNGENVVWDEVQAGAMNIALNVLDQSAKRNTEWYDNTKPAREFLKNNTLKLNEKQLAEVQSAFGSYTEFRRELYNKAKFSKTEGISLEQAWRDLSGMFPDTFDPDTPDVDMPTLLHDEVLNMYDRPIENPYGYGMKEYAADLAMRLYGEYMALPERKTFADRQQKKLEMQRARYNTLMEQQREQAKAKYEKLRDQRDITKYKTNIEKNAKSLYSWLTKPNNSKHVPEALRNKTADLLKTLEFDGKKGYMWKDAMRNLQTWMQQVDRAKTNPDIDNPLIEYAPDLIDNMQSLLDSASKYNNISDMPLDKLKELNNIVAAVKHTVTTANTVIADGRRQYIDDIGGNIIKTAQVQRPKAREFMRKHPYAYKMASVVSGFFNSGNIKPIYFFDNIGGEMKTLFNDVRQASYKAALLVNTIRREYAQIKDKYHYKEWADKAGDLLTIQTKGGSNVSITREQALDIYATAKREKLIGTQHLTKDGFVFDKDVVQKNGKLIETATNDNVNKPLSEETIAEISDWLTKEQKGYADALVELMSTKGAELGNEVTMLMYGINRFAESYYIPIISAQQFIETAFNGRVSEAMSWMNKGFTKNTVAGARNPIVITGITQKALQHMADMAIYNAMAIPQDTMAKVYNYKQRGEDGGANTYIRAELDKAYGQHTSKYIKTFINDISGNITVDPRDSMASKMISAFRRNAISGKLSVAIQQPSAIIRATALIDSKYFFGHVGKNTYDTAKKYSGTAVIKEVGGFDAYTGKGLVQWMADNDKLNFGNIRDAVAGWLPQKMDEITWCRIWKACENEVADTTALERGSEEFYKAVGHRFDDVIEYTQVYDSVISRSEYMRSKSVGAKLFTSFKAEPTVSYNMYWYALKHMDEKGGKARLLRTAASIIGAGVFNAMLKSVITAIRDDDENQNYVDKYVEALVGNLVGTPLKKVPYIGEYIYLGGELDTLGSLPLVNEVLSMLQGYTSSRSELKVIQDLINAAGDLDNEKKGLDERLLRMAKATSQMFGIPLDAFIKDWLGVVKEAYKAISGNEPELSGNILYEIREGLGVKQELELYKGVDKAITTGDYTRLDKQFKTMVERDTTTDPTKKARETVRAAVRQYFDAGEVKAGDAKRILVRCGYKMDDAEAMITKWDFWRDYPEAHDTSIEDGTETLAAKYFEYAKPANIDKTLFYDVYKFNGSAKADKDKNGNSIRNSKRDKVADYINKQRLTKAQKDALWLACGYKESTLDEAPWR